MCCCALNLVRDAECPSVADVRSAGPLVSRVREGSDQLAEEFKFFNHESAVPKVTFVRHVQCTQLGGMVPVSPPVSAA